MLKNKKNKFYIILVIILFNTFVFNQEQELELEIYTNPSGTDYWWLNNNNYGRTNSELLVGFSWDLKQEKTSYKLNFFGDIDSENKTYIGESFIKHNFSKKTFLKIGRYYRDFSSYLNDELSSGSMLISHNAEPMPKIGFVTSQKIKRLKKVDFKFGISHAVFDKNSSYTKSPLLHEKFIYMNIKNNDYRIGFGLVHEAMWAGATEELGNLPDSFKDFIKVFFSEDGEQMEGDAHANALGNHLGIWDFFFERGKNNKIIKFYYQHIFEDTSGLRLRNEIDGLWGIELKNYIPETTLLFEYLDTTHCCIDPPYVDDQYYDNYQYNLGWSYKNYTLGNAFISRLPFTTTKVLHFGLSGNILSYNYRLRASRKIDANDNINYRIDINKKIKENNSLNIFIINDINGKNQLGIGMSRFF